MRIKLAWRANARPDCLFEISELAQVAEERFNAAKGSSMRTLNTALKYEINNRICLKVTRLDEDTLRMIGFSDVLFATFPRN